MPLSNRLTNIIAFFLLSFVFVITVFSIRDDSLTMDELAHLPAGYSYLTQKDMRLNPEHPPLIKDLAALPLLFIGNINFPSDVKAWKEDVNGQWDFGRYFLYQTGNPDDKMIFWGQLPMILILILLGFYIFKWSKELFGNKAALLSLFLFSFSPTFLAHGRLVTTDVGAAAGIFIATYYFLKILKSPTLKNVALSGIAFGLAELAKFTAVILVPFFLFLALIWWLIKSRRRQEGLKILILVLMVFTIGYLLLWPVYQYHVWNYPPEKQLSDTEVYLKDTLEPVRTIILWAADKPIIRAYAHYFTGLSMVFHRVAGGNTTYFLGEVSNLGWRNYFPIVYLIKEPLTFHILTLIALLYAVWLARRRPGGGGLSSHFSEFAMLTFILIYWAVSIKGNLNIGIRHLLPVFPFTFILVSATIINFSNRLICGGRTSANLAQGVLIVLILWQAFLVVSVYPHFLAYFNEAVGGPDNGYKYVVDSNLDWGQDLKRLKSWTEENNIEKIYIDYFGGSSPEYYFQNKYAPWRGTRDSKEFPKGNYLAVSATFLQGGRGKPIPGFNQPSGYYHWLDTYTPVEKIGYSIFVYYIPSPP